MSVFTRDLNVVTRRTILKVSQRVIQGSTAIFEIDRGRHTRGRYFLREEAPTTTYVCNAVLLVVIASDHEMARQCKAMQGKAWFGGGLV